MTTPPDAAHLAALVRAHRWLPRRPLRGADQDGRVVALRNPTCSSPDHCGCGHRPIPARCCPTCLTTGTRQPTTAVTEADGAAIAGLIETL